MSSGVKRRNRRRSVVSQKSADMRRTAIVSYLADRAGQIHRRGTNLSGGQDAHAGSPRIRRDHTGRGVFGLVAGGANALARGGDVRVRWDDQLPLEELCLI